MLVPKNEASDHRIDDETAVSGGLRLVPARMPLEVLADSMLFDAGNFFERLFEQCADIEARANGSKEDDGNTLNRASRAARLRTQTGLPVNRTQRGR